MIIRTIKEGIKIWILVIIGLALLGLSFYPPKNWLPYQSEFPSWFTERSVWFLMQENITLITGSFVVAFCICLILIFKRM